MAFLKGKWTTKNTLKIIPSKIMELRGRISFALPKKYEGTIVEKASLFARNIFLDYKEMVLDTILGAKKSPKKAAFILTGLGFLGYCSTANPDEQSFRERLLICEHDVMLIGESTRNPKSVQRLEFIETSYNEGRINLLSLGVISLMWVADHDKESGSYEAQCSYLKPKFFSYPSRVVDVGFLGKWWILSRIMEDYDINPAEYNEDNMLNTTNNLLF